MCVTVLLLQVLLPKGKIIHLRLYQGVNIDDILQGGDSESAPLYGWARVRARVSDGSITDIWCQATSFCFELRCGWLPGFGS